MNKYKIIRDVSLVLSLVLLFVGMKLKATSPDKGQITLYIAIIVMIVSIVFYNIEFYSNKKK